MVIAQLNNDELISGVIGFFASVIIDCPVIFSKVDTVIGECIITGSVLVPVANLCVDPRL